MEELQKKIEDRLFAITGRVCFCGQKTDVPAAERAMQEITLLYEHAQHP